jgi:hypothetical protein
MLIRFIANNVAVRQLIAIFATCKIKKDANYSYVITNFYSSTYNANQPELGPRVGLWTVLPMFNP